MDRPVCTIRWIVLYNADPVSCTAATGCADTTQCCRYMGLASAGVLRPAVCGSTPDFCDANGLALSGPSAWYGNQPCGNGIRGSGLCPAGQGCCSDLGHCDLDYCGTNAAPNANPGKALARDNFRMPLCHTHRCAYILHSNISWL